MIFEILYFLRLFLSLALNEILDIFQLLNIHCNAFIIQPFFIEIDDFVVVYFFFLHLLHFVLKLLRFGS